MLDTKLKNRHKLAVALMMITILIPTFFVMSQYGDWYYDYYDIEESINHSVVTSDDFLGNFVEASYILYNTEGEKAEYTDEIKDMLSEHTPDRLTSFEELYPYLDYRVKDENGKDVSKSLAGDGSEVTETNLDDFAFAMSITYDENGVPDAEIRKGEYKSEQSVVLRKILNEFDDVWNSEEVYGKVYEEVDGVWESLGMEKPENRTYIYAMTEENFQTYLDNESYGTHDYALDAMVNVISILMLLVAAAALFYPVFTSLHTGNEKIFKAPFEVVIVVFSVMAALISGNCGWLLQKGEGNAGAADFLIWVCVFAVTYWAASSLRQIYVLGIKKYIREKTFLYPSWKYVKKAWDICIEKGKSRITKIYQSFHEIDLSEKSNKVILKIVVLNFLVVSILCMMWSAGIIGLIVYSVILFFVLRKYYNDIKEKYRVLLKATNEIAEGNLDAYIWEDLGIFNPFKIEIEKIQAGFKKAVDEEVKSQRMKTELITNVSHDLKTPLTAIITYVNLLKDEKDEEKRNLYTEVLERKSLRLKVLIEDLFEISKASSKNVILNIVDVDIVNLFKQAKLELDDKIKEAELDFRCTYPEGKLIVPLDSQKTYRVFENLLINIVKYAMPKTRVYTEIVREDGKTVVRMKNVSAAELNFNTDEITERFVRGDVSRNTEGSGLGLAIAKSFVELQKGEFRIETEADLFKVEIRW